MKFSQNTRVVNPNTINAKYTAVTDPMAYGQNGKEWDAFGSALNVGMKVAQKEQDDNDAADVLEAKNKIQTELTGAFYGENGILTTGVGENAKGMTDRATRTTTTTFDDVAKHYNPRVQRALRQNMGETLLAYQKTAMQQEQTERKKQAAADYTNINEDTINKAAQGQNYLDDNILSLGMNEIRRNTLAYGRLQGWNGKQYQAMLRDSATKLYGTAINAAIADNDPTRAQVILSAHAKEMDQGTVIQLNQKLNSDKEMHTYKNDTKWELDNDKSILNTDGTYSEEKGRNYVRNVWAKQTDKVTVTVPGGGDGDWTGNATYNDLIKKYSAQYEVDPADVATIMAIESSNNPNAVSPVGAIGLMQLMPDTARGLGVDPNTVEGNIEGGVKYWKQMLDTFGGNKELAAAAYNAGPKAVKDAGGVPNYKETKNYVAKYKEVRAEMEKKRKVDVSNLPMQDIEDKGLEHTNNALKSKYVQLHDWALKKFGKEMVVSGGWRSPEHNKQVNGSPNSHHLFGDAVDVDYSMFTAAQREEIKDYAKNSLGFNRDGDGIEDNHGGNGWHLHLTYEDDGSGGGGSTTKVIERPKYSERQQQEFEQVFMAELRQRNADIQARRQEQARADNDEIMNMTGPQTLEKLKQLKAEGQSWRYDNAVSAAHKYHPELFAAPKSDGSGSRSVGSGGKQYYQGASGATYTVNQYNNALELYEEYKSRRSDRNDTISRTDQRKYNHATNIINDVNGWGGDKNNTDTIDYEPALKIAMYAVTHHPNREEAEWYCVTKGLNEREAESYVDMAIGQGAEFAS